MTKKLLLLAAPLLLLLAGCGTVTTRYSLQMKPDGTRQMVIASEPEIMDVTHDAIQSQFPVELHKLTAPELGWAWIYGSVSSKLQLKKVAGESKDGTRVTGWGIHLELNESGNDYYSKQYGNALVKALEYAFKHRNVPNISARNVVPATDADVVSSANLALGKASGTGFFVSTDGYLITNHHVIADATRIDVYASNGNIYRAKVINSDSSNDVALLKVEAQTTPFSIVQTGALQKGAQVFTLGYPLPSIEGNEVKATFGRINALSGAQGDIRFIQIDVPIQPGNSGGPLIDDNGAVVGITSASVNQQYVVQTAGTVAQNVNYAVKSEYFLPLLKYAQVNLTKGKAVPGAIKNPSQFEPSVVHIVTTIGRHQDNAP